MCQFVSLEFKQDKSLHTVIVEYQVNVIVLCIRLDVFLPIYKSKATSEFHNKLLKVIQQGLLHLRFVEFRILTKAHEFCNNGILDVLLRVFTLNYWQREF